MNLVFILTNRCNAQCLHCSTSCGPDRQDALGRSLIIELMEQAAGLAGGAELDFSITGGEPFLEFEELLDVVRHGHGLGAFMSCVSNGYWASSEARTRHLIEQLKQAGLNRLAISSSAFHQQFVAASRVERALRIAREYALEVYLKFVCKASDTAQDKAIIDTARSLGIEGVQLMDLLPSIRDGAQLPAHEYPTPDALPLGSCPAAEISVRENGEVYSCCTPGANTPLLALGDARATPFERIVRRFRIGGAQQILRRDGPAYFAEAARQQGHGDRLRSGYAGVCDLCAHIAQDAVLAGVARQCAEVAEQQAVESMLRPPGGRSGCSVRRARQI